MFIARTKELAKVRNFINSNNNAMLIYGKRRVGKTRLIKEAIASSTCPVIFYQCSAESYDMNLEYFTDEIKRVFSDTYISFKSFYDAFSFLSSKQEKIIVVLDEYGEFKKSYGQYTADSMLQKIIDSLKDTKVKLIISGSAVSMMKELLEEQNPLFDRFSYILHLEEFDYYDASLFFPDLSSRNKVAFYSIFGGSPNVLESIDSSLSLEENMENLLLAPDGRVRSFVERSLMQEYGKIGPALSLFQLIGNSKKTYTEIKDKLDPTNTGNLSKLLDKFISNEVIRKVSPINHKNEKKRSFYTLDENLMRSYFTYVHPNRSQLELLGEKSVFSSKVHPSLDTFISYRFEEIARSYFSRLARTGRLSDIIDIGTYWYDDKKSKQNEEFDCVLEASDGYEVYEVKYLKAALTEEKAKDEADKIYRIKDFTIKQVGFISIEGFSFSNSNFKLITGEDLFTEDLRE